MIASLSLSLALAADLEGGAAAVVAIGHSEKSEPLVGAEGFGTWRLHPRFAPELAVSGGWRPGGGWGAVTPRIRLFLGPAEHPVLSVFAGGGAQVEQEVRPIVVGGASLDLFHSGGARPRAQLGYTWSPGEDSRVVLGVGAVFGRSGPEPEPEPEPEPLPAPEPEPEPEPAPEPTVVQLAEAGMVWVPGPVCQWLGPEAATAAMATRGMRIERLSVVSASTRRTEPGEDGEDGESTPPSGPTPGQVVVTASTVDHVWVDDERTPVEEGVAVASRPEGPVEVRITGGGTSSTFLVGVVDDHAVWLSSEAPAPHRVTFASGSVALGPDASARLAEIASASGDWSFELHGSFSPEGDPAANEALARRRATVARDALLQAGIPADRLRLGEPRPPEEGLEPTEQRAAVIVPLEAW